MNKKAKFTIEFLRWSISQCPKQIKAVLKYTTVEYSCLWSPSRRRNELVVQLWTVLYFSWCLLHHNILWGYSSRQAHIENKEEEKMKPIWCEKRRWNRLDRLKKDLVQKQVSIWHCTTCIDLANIISAHLKAKGMESESATNKTIHETDCKCQWGKGITNSSMNNDYNSDNMWYISDNKIVTLTIDSFTIPFLTGWDILLK